MIKKVYNSFVKISKNNYAIISITFTINSISNNVTPLQDSMVQPRQSSHFEFYQDGSGKVVVPLRNSSIYIEDRLGLKVRKII